MTCIKDAYNALFNNVILFWDHSRASATKVQRDPSLQESLFNVITALLVIDDDSLHKV